MGGVNVLGDSDVWCSLTPGRPLKAGSRHCQGYTFLSVSQWVPGNSQSIELNWALRVNYGFSQKNWRARSIPGGRVNKKRGGGRDWEG